MALPDSFSFGTDPAQLLTRFLGTRSYSQVAVLADENTRRLCYPLIGAVLPAHHLFTLPAGEQHKTLGTCEKVWGFLTDAQLDRHALVVVVGGGVPGDLGGFCAATYKRGIDFVLMPTTLLAQVDASIGGKLGIDFRHLKNHLGVFREPAGTLICPAFLSTLPDRELRSGYAEVIKHALIADRVLWEQLTARASWQAGNWSELVPASVDIKQRVVFQDPSEKGLRKILNFGHTIGHAIESAALEEGTSLFHGEAIAIGMICESYLSTKKGLLPKASLEAITHYLRMVFGTIPLPAEERVLELIQQDKKNKGGKILAALLQEIGHAVWDVEISTHDVSDALNHYSTNHT